MDLKHRVKIKNGKFIFRDPVRFHKDLMRHEGKDVVVYMGEDKNRRSISQNNYYWGVVIATIMDSINGPKRWTKEEADKVHEAMKIKFLSDKIVMPKTGEILPTVQSTSTMNTSEFHDFVEAVKGYAAAELGIYVPDANEYL